MTWRVLFALKDDLVPTDGDLHAVRLPRRQRGLSQPRVGQALATMAHGFNPH
jgi:hypothetical protein